MAHIDREHATDINKTDVLDDLTTHLDGYDVSFISVHQDVDGAQLLKGLPDDLCQSHHWGVVEAGELFFSYADGRMEAVHAGEAFVVLPGHSPRMAAGSRFVMFSPSDEIAATNEAMRRNLEALSAP